MKAASRRYDCEIRGTPPSDAAYKKSSTARCTLAADQYLLNRCRRSSSTHVAKRNTSARTSVESAKHVKNVSRTRWISPPWQRRRGQRWHAEGELNLRFSSTCFIMSLCVFKRAGRYPGPRRRGEGVLVSLATAKESSSPRRRHGSEVPECYFLGAAGEAVGQD